MKLASVEAIVRALNEAYVRYIIVGGLAVNAHGHGRTTYDVDLVVKLTYDNVVACFDALNQIDCHPLVPITKEQFGDEAVRRRLIQEKEMVVLQFYSDTHRETRLAIFVREPFDFDTEETLCLRGKIADDLEAPFLSLLSLIRLKQEANRPKDQEDIRHLTWGL